MLLAGIKNQEGFVLIWVLLIMQILMLLSLSGIESIWLENKLNKSLLQRYLMMNDLEQSLTMVEQKIQNRQIDCVIPLVSSIELAGKPFLWWQQSTCLGNLNSVNYYYVIERLSIDPCIQIKYKHQIAELYRVTILGVSLDQTSKAMLQSTIAVMGLSQEQCDGDILKVELGRQSLVSL